jgi:hypothetical protein
MATLKTVPNINSLEKSILKSALLAQREYEAMTGEWLWHGPESFLQVIVAQRVAKETGHYVYIDVSRKKIEKEMGRRRGPPASTDGQRADISVWYKNSMTLRAVIETKRTINLAPIQADADRMKRWLRQARPPTAAYILAFLEATTNRPKMTPTKAVENIFDRWVERTGWRWIGSAVHSDPDEPKWAWGIVLMRNPT